VTLYCNGWKFLNIFSKKITFPSIIQIIQTNFHAMNCCDCQK
jgi:hypothetical protein